MVWPSMTLNGVWRLFCVTLLNSVDFEANDVKVVEAKRQNVARSV